MNKHLVWNLPASWNQLKVNGAHFLFWSTSETFSNFRLQPLEPESVCLAVVQIHAVGVTLSRAAVVLCFFKEMMIRSGRGFLKSDRTALSAQGKSPRSCCFQEQIVGDFAAGCFTFSVCHEFELVAENHCLTCTNYSTKPGLFGSIHQNPPNSHWPPLNLSSRSSPNNWNWT